MLLSMTGFGKAIGNFQSKKVSIEIRTLNSKSLDLNVRIAPIYREVESEIRKIVGQLLEFPLTRFGIRPRYGILRKNLVARRD